MRPPFSFRGPCPARPTCPIWPASMPAPSVLLTAAVLAALLGAGGCGESSKSLVPQDGNPFAAARTGTDSTLEVVTWNLENFAKNGEVTADYVAQAISGLDVDIVAMQEIESVVHFRAVDEALADWEGYKANSAYADLDLAFLYRTTGKLAVESIYEILTGEAALPRSPLVLQGAFDGLPLIVVNNHFKCCGDGVIDPLDDYDDESRRLQASLLLQEYILEHWSGLRVIVVGDFNDELTDPEAGNVFSPFLDAPQQWRFVDLPIAEGPPSGWSYPSWPSHLDHVLVTAELFAGCDGPDAEVQVLRLYDYLPSGWSAYDKNISDHLPVLLKVKP